MNLILFDDDLRINLLPLAYTKPIAKLRLGILTIEEKWQHELNCSISYKTVDYLNSAFPCNMTSDNYWVNSRAIPNDELLNAIKLLNKGESIYDGEQLVAARCDGELSNNIKKTETIETEWITSITDFFSKNDAELKADFQRLTNGRTSQQVSDTNIVFGKHSVFLEEGAVMEACTINTNSGPVYIGKNALVMENCAIRGAFAMQENSVLKMSSKVYGATTLGPHCKAGGELNNVILMGYSNKGHDGFLGNSVIGEWCNLGADTNNSNLKNNYADVKLWNYKKGGFKPTGLQFCGLIMGDHSKCGINTMFNTGTVVGVSANIFGSGFPRNFIPSFSWGGNSGFSTYQLHKVFETMELVMKRRAIELTEKDKNILTYLFNKTSSYRFWDKK